MKKLFHRTRTYRSCRHCRRKTWQHSLFLVYTVFSRNLLLLHWHLWTCFQKLAAHTDMWLFFQKLVAYLFIFVKLFPPDLRFFTETFILFDTFSENLLRPHWDLCFCFQKFAADSFTFVIIFQKFATGSLVFVSVFLQRPAWSLIFVIFVSLIK